MHIQGQEDCDAFDAWRKAVLSANDMPELRAMVLRLGTWSGMTTSGVERTHTVQDWLLDGRRGNLSARAENDEIKLQRPQWIDAYSMFSCRDLAVLILFFALLLL